MTDKSGKAKSGIIRFPLIQVTGTLIMHHDKLPAGMGPITREIISKQLQPAFDFIDKLEARIAKKYWVELHEDDKPSYLKLMLVSRISMTKRDYYNKDMMNILKRIRCSHNPSSFECALKDE